MPKTQIKRPERVRARSEHLLFDAMARSARSDIAAFAFIVDAKDGTAESFYRRYGFLRLAAASHRLFLPMAEITPLLG